MKCRSWLVNKHRSWLGRPCGWITRVARMLGAGRNPLRRPSDRIESALLAVLLAAFAVGAPLVSVAVGQAARQASEHEVNAQRSWRLVHATLLRGTARVVGPPGASAWVPARWMAPDGRTRTGQILVSGLRAKGSTVPIWVNQQGRAEGPPLPQAKVQARIIFAMIAAPLALAMALIVVAVVARKLLDRRRLAGWEAAWRSTGPRWSRRV